MWPLWQELSVTEGPRWYVSHLDSQRETQQILSFVLAAHLRVCHAEAIAFPCHKRPDESHSSFEEWRKCDFDSGNERFSCDQCHKSYGDVKNLLRHKRSKHPKKVDINAKIVKRITNFAQCMKCMHVFFESEFLLTQHDRNFHSIQCESSSNKWILYHTKRFSTDMISRVNAIHRQYEFNILRK